MTYKDRLQADLKTAMLTGDKNRVSALKNIKSAILYEEVAAGSRETGLADQDIQRILTKEAKKRQESADLYSKGGNQTMADAELAEKAIIQEYLPEQLDEAAISELVEAVVAEQGPVTKQTMGAVIAAVKAKSGGAADGSIVARLVRERITD